nr:PQQ-dependent dehydrogenase, methanol/ethanol family [Aromatoleum evansii]
MNSLIAFADERVQGYVDSARMSSLDSEPQNWVAPGRDQKGTYFSPLETINEKNVSRLGHAWSYKLGTYRGQEATPIVIDGVMYAAGIWGRVYALEAATGNELWTYDPQVNGQVARNTCCDVVNRGLVVWQGMVYVASTDGRLHALDAATGKRIWVVDTIEDKKLPYASTGSPQIAKDVVVIGNAGADLGQGGVRGYVTAYDLKTGAQKWRFYTVPGAPGSAPEHPEMEVAQKTWDPQRAAFVKGGGTVWDGMAYDPELNLLYVGTGNGAPYDQRKRSPAGGDNLYLSSILAINPDTGRLVWHYQTTPGDIWDFTAVQKMIQADLVINGRQRKVLMQAPKNGFFYVLDRATGELLSAKNYSYVNWASHVDMKTGRPAVTKQGDYYTGPKLLYPSWSGAHSWQPMAFNPKTNLVYIPVIDIPNFWVDMPNSGGKLKFVNGFFTTAGITPDGAFDAKTLKPLFGTLPDLKQIKAPRPGALVREVLRAWDPVKQKVVWEQETSNGYRSYDGGVLTTAGNLVFQGRGDGDFVVYAADTGKQLKRINTGSTIMAAPMTYSVNGTQYVAVQTGYGGTAIVTPISPKSAAATRVNENRILVFKLDGDEVPKPPLRNDEPFPSPPKSDATPEQIKSGEIKFNQHCAQCHVFSPNVTPDLRRISEGVHQNFKEIVLRGQRAFMGMGRFDDVLTENDADEIHAYLISEQANAYNLEHKQEEKLKQRASKH